MDYLVTPRQVESTHQSSVILICPSQTKPSPDDLRGKIFMMIEHYPDKTNPIPKKGDDLNSDSSSSDSDFSDSEQAQNMKAFHDAHKGESAKVHPQLAALGVYAQSIKPEGNWLVQELLEPWHALINISESGLGKLLPHSLEGLVGHACKHLRRCYPRGTRVMSSNMDPLPVWRAGTQVAALNMHVWDLGTQLNAALFEGSQGWVLKPESLRGGHKRSGEVTFKVEVVGADDGQYLWGFLLVCILLTRETMNSAKPHECEESSDVFYCRAIYTRRQQVIQLEDSNRSQWRSHVE